MNVLNNKKRVNIKPIYLKSNRFNFTHSLQIKMTHDYQYKLNKNYNFIKITNDEQYPVYNQHYRNIE